MYWEFNVERRKLVWLAVVAVLCAIGAAVTAHFQPHVEKESSDSSNSNVPLGVEQAAIVTYSGPEIAVAPYKWGVAVNVRIADVAERDGQRIYDVRYIVNRAGTFDLKDYLVAANGGALEGLPSFKFVGDPKLSKNLDKRIQETEVVKIDVGGRYYETLAVLGALWIVWLLLLIFWKRPHAVVAVDNTPAAPTLAELLRGFLAQLEAGTLDAEAKAKMETTIFQCWRHELGLHDATMSQALEEMARHEKTREPLRKLQHWLYHPTSPVRRAEIVDVITPYTHEALPVETVSAS